ncbi:MAG: ligase-associated DNA damage response exonuclease [Parachlamydia sp.]|nr:ligase-associated DNA damage response exonuclease [Parachlamydia sp.]
MLAITPKGLYCPPGDFYIDPLSPVPIALITHAHGDHARWGHQKYVIQEQAVDILRYRQPDAYIESTPYRQTIKMGDVWVSFHPAGHILGSAQIRIEYRGQVAVVSGDYKREADPTCAPFEPVECHLFVTESTFALPIYRWADPRKVADEIFSWWQTNAAESCPSLLFCYSLGKAQRILAMLKQLMDQEIYVHGSMETINACYRSQGIALPKTAVVTQQDRTRDYSKALILAPLSAFRSVWMNRFKGVRTAFASGWMAIRGTKRRQGIDRGFILSDHADWEGLLRTIRETKASRVWVTHGDAEIFSRYLKENVGIEAESIVSLTPTVEED